MLSKIIKRHFGIFKEVTNRDLLFLTYPNNHKSIVGVLVDKLIKRWY